MPKVKLELESRPESLALVRGVLVAVADLLGFDPGFVHTLKTVVSEACNNVILHAYDGEAGPLEVSLEIAPDAVEAMVRDWGRGIREVVPSEDRSRVGLAVISALADRAQFIRAPGGGTEVRMAFVGPHGMRTAELATRAERGQAVNGSGEGPILELSGDAIATISPVGLLAGVLARVATVLAAQARFSLDRFCDVYLVTDAVAAHAAPSAVGDRLGFSAAAHDHRLELSVGPFRTGSGGELLAQEGFGRLSSALSALAVDLTVEPVADAEIWRLVVLDIDGGPPAAGPR